MVFRLASTGCQTLSRIQQLKRHLPLISCRASSTVNGKVKFLALETKWHAKWMNKEHATKEDEDLESVPYPLTPVYSNISEQPPS
ncbi:MAG: hypothetical protein MMC33_007666 [Icmadophila ericetorum]|nr:hypothetical protein [Icmadophila ericetorum]